MWFAYCCEPLIAAVRPNTRMSVYQKILICVFRTIGLLGLGYLIAQAIPMAFAYGLDAQRLIAFGWPWVPHVVCLLLLILGAVPLAKIITMGIDDA
jgi:hypothetical protein